MLRILAICGLLLILQGCQTVAPTRDRFVMASPPSTLMDCDRLKRTKFDANTLTNRQIRLMFENRERIISECFQDVNDLRLFLARNQGLIDLYNQEIAKK